MRERPILFSAPMVRAILEGRKTQTRRIIKPSWARCLDPDEDDDRESIRVGGPYGAPGDRLWVRETLWWGQWTEEHFYNDLDGASRSTVQWCHPEPGDLDSIAYVADGPAPADRCERWTKRPAIHMPRWASRITLEVTGVRVERAKSISKDDAIAEGACRFDDIPDLNPYGQGARWSMEDPQNTDHCLGSPQMAFANLWIKINGQESWDANPWVWAVSFARVIAEHDDQGKR